MRSLRLQRQLAICVIVVAVAAAYSNSFHGDFVLDDAASIKSNPTITRWWRLDQVLSPPGGGITVQGRPIVNLTLAINYAFGGPQVFGYHLGNLLIHLCGCLVLFGLARRTTKSIGIGWAVALLWGLHPLQTEAVTYMIQRAESLMALFYLLTLYGFVRSVDPEEKDPSFWKWSSIAACLLGMGTKEVMVSAPLIVFLYDRAFVAGSFRKAWSARRTYYLGLAASWLVLAALMLGTGSRGNTSGFGSGVPVLVYWTAQPVAIVHYLGVMTWPTHLVFDYGTPWVTHPIHFLPQYLLFGVLVATVAILFFLNSPLGFFGIWFLAILAPTCLIPGNRQVMAEHRVYLALAPVLLILGFAIGSLGPKGRRVCYLTTAGVAIAFGCLTFLRNRVYISPLVLYQDVVAKAPYNWYGEANYGATLIAAGRYWEAETHLRRSLALSPTYAIAENDLGSALNSMKRFDEAEECYRQAAELNPQLAAARQNLGFALMRRGKKLEAIEQIKAGLALGYDLGVGYDNLGSIYASMGRIPEAIDAFQHSVASDPLSQPGHMNLGIALVGSGKKTEGLAEVDLGLALNPRNSVAHFNRGTVLGQLGRTKESIGEFRTAIELEPRNPLIHEGLAGALIADGQIDAAVAEYRISVDEQPTRALGHYNLAKALMRQENTSEALSEYRESLSLDPGLDKAKKALDALGEKH